MDHDREIRLLAAEAFALQQILSAVLYELKSISPAVEAAIGRGLDNAASQVEHLAIHPEHCVTALRIVDELRTACFGHRGEPTRVVELRRPESPASAPIALSSRRP